MIIQTIDPGRALQRLYRLQRLPDTTLAPEIVPVVVVDNLATPTPWDQPDRRPGVGYTLQVAAAGEFAIIALVAPPQVDVEVTRVVISSTTAGTVRIRRPLATLTGLGATSTPAWMDGELAGRPSTFVQADSVVALPTGRTLFLSNIAANETIVLPFSVRVPGFRPGQTPGSNAILVDHSTAVATMTVGYEFIEENRGG